MEASISRTERFGWVLLLGTLVALAVPWFLWGTSRVVAGLPLWLWWHICWMGLAAVVFFAFSSRAWGLGITDAGTASSERGEQI